MSLGLVGSHFEETTLVGGTPRKCQSLETLLKEIRKEAKRLGGDDASGIAFPRFVRDRKRLRQALAKGSLGRFRPDQRSHSQNTLLRVTAIYEEETARLAPEEPARDMAQMLAWARQAAQSVHLGRSHLGGACLPFRHFVDASVVCVILLEDVGETFGGLQLRSLEQAVDRQVECFAKTPRSLRWRSSGNSAISPASILGRSPQEAYLDALGQSLGLLGDLLDRLWRPEDAPQRDECDGWLTNAIAEVVRSRDISRAFNRYVTRNEAPPTAAAAALERVVATLDVPGFVEANRANIFMRAMFEAGVRASIARNGARRSAWDRDWWALAAETRRIGAQLEGLGNMANDLATLFREWGEGFAGNFLLVQGFSSGAFSPEMVRASFDELADAFSAAERRELMVEVGKAYFASGPGEASAHLARRAPACRETRALLGAICRDRVIEEGVEYWRRESDALRVALREGALRRFFADDGLWSRQVAFLFQYLTANALV